MKKIIISTYAVCCIQLCFAQISGNQAYSNSNKLKYDTEKLNNLYLSDSSFTIEAKVMKNLIADYYVAVFGLKQQDSNIKNANTKIDERINNFISSAVKLGIGKADIYTDILTQNCVTDYKKNGSTFEEYVKSIETAKNVIIKFTTRNQIKNLLAIASEQNILDLIKVDYQLNDPSKIYDELFEAATAVINKKNKMYQALTVTKLKSEAMMVADKFNIFYPSDMYKNYTAYTESSISGDEESGIRIKSLPKIKPFITTNSAPTASTGLLMKKY